jgi:glycosyltransferase involved in cell wall biosynthesis
VRFVRDLTDDELRWVYANADTLLAVSLEDYGLTPLEAAAFGVPSLSLRAGGYLDTVVDGVTGLHVESADPVLVRLGLDEMGRHGFDPMALRAHAAEFSEVGFAERLRAELADVGNER